MIVVYEKHSALAVVLFLKGKLRNQILARKLIIINLGSLQNRPLIHQTLAILASIQCLVDGWDDGGGTFLALAGWLSYEKEKKHGHQKKERG